MFRFNFNVYMYCTSIHRPKHPTKVYVWAGISGRGRTRICLFESIMKKELFVEILDGTLLPFVNEIYPSGHNFMQDNDPKNSSGYTKQWMRDNDIPLVEDPHQVTRPESD